MIAIHTVGTLHMRLHEYQAAPNSRRVHIFMAEKGIDLPRVPVDIRKGENLADEFRVINPIGRIPVLELDDGSFLSESVAICRYLEGLHAEPCLFGEQPLEQAHIEMWNRRAELNLFREITMAFRNISGFFKDRETPVPEWGHICAETAANAVPVFDAQLAKSEFLAGDRFSIADITLLVAVEFADFAKISLPKARHVTRWHELVSTRRSASAQ